MNRLCFRAGKAFLALNFFLTTAFGMRGVTALQPVGDNVLNTNFSQPATGLLLGIYRFRAVDSNPLGAVFGTNQARERLAFHDAGFVLPGTFFGSAEWGDYDSDGRLDFAISGNSGTMAQDFYAAFAVGVDDKHISMVDADGVALAAIQGLNQKVEDLKKELSRRDAENDEMKRQLAELRQLISLRENGPTESKHTTQPPTQP